VTFFTGKKVLGSPHNASFGSIKYEFRLYARNPAQQGKKDSLNNLSASFPARHRFLKLKGLWQT
jgi:hypothetical protein